MIQCLQCLSDLANESQFCGKCGAQISDPTKSSLDNVPSSDPDRAIENRDPRKVERVRKKGLIVLAFVGLVGLFIGLGLVSFGGESPKKVEKPVSRPVTRVASCEDILTNWVSWYRSILYSPSLMDTSNANNLVQSTLYQETSSGMGGVTNLYAWVQVEAAEPGSVQSVGSECAALQDAGYDGTSLPQPPS